MSRIAPARSTANVPPRANVRGLFSDLSKCAIKAREPPSGCVRGGQRPRSRRDRFVASVLFPRGNGGTQGADFCGQAVERDGISSAAVMSEARELIEVVAELSCLAGPKANGLGELGAGCAAGWNRSTCGGGQDFPRPRANTASCCFSRALDRGPLGRKQPSRDGYRPVLVSGGGVRRVRLDRYRPSRHLLLPRPTEASVRSTGAGVTLTLASLAARCWLPFKSGGL